MMITMLKKLKEKKSLIKRILNLMTIKIADLKIKSY